jgi:Icc-related predicted phosphoesterase
MFGDGKMKIYAVADIHGSQFRLNLVLKNIEKYSPDMVIVCGDITQFGPGEVAKNFLDQIPTETLTVTGNIDSSDVKDGIDDSKALFVEQKRVVKNGLPFFGVNKFDLSLFNSIEEKKLVDDKTIIVSHMPPYGGQDKIFIGLHGGSKELREIVDKYKPRLVLCGHIHEDPGFTKLNQTTVVNCSMGKRGEGALVEINGEISVKLID